MVKLSKLTIFLFMIDWIEFYTVSAIYQSRNGGFSFKEN